MGLSDEARNSIISELLLNIPHHRHLLTRDENAELGLRVTKTEEVRDDFSKLVWRKWKTYESEFPPALPLQVE